MDKNIVKTIFSILLISIGMLASLSHAADDTDTAKLPIPRFVTLKAQEVNLRKGPGSDYPITWTYQRQYYPVKIIAEYKNWRKIQDHYLHTGWVHKTLLSGKNTAMIIRTKQNNVPIFQKSRDSSPIIGYAQPYVIANLTKCNQEWCVLEFDSLTGWVNKKFIWGVLE